MTYEEQDPDQLWLHGVSDEHLDRQCPNCGKPIDLDLLQQPEDEPGIILCPECQAELPWGSLEDIPRNDWFNWACLEKEDYPARDCFAEPTQKALSLSVSLNDPRGADVDLEITTTSSGDVLVKVHNRDTGSYYRWTDTSIEGSYTIVRFRPV